MTEKASRAEVGAPRSRTQKSSYLSEAQQEKPVKAANNMKDGKDIMMSFNMPVAWHSRFKMTAASRNMKMRELLMECFDLYEKQNRNS
jgi:hypothetical protein